MEEAEKPTTKTFAAVLSVAIKTSAVERWREGLTFPPGVPNAREGLGTSGACFGGELVIFQEMIGNTGKIFTSSCDKLALVF